MGTPTARGWTWRLVERWLSGILPARSLDGILGDLEDDYARRRAVGGRLRAALWLWGEARSLAGAYRAGRRPGPSIRGHPMPTFFAPWPQGFGQDLRFALRSLRHNRGFSATVVLTLGLAIGLCTSLFTVFNGLALRPWDVRDPDSIVVPFTRPVGTRGFQNLVTVAEFEYLREQSRTLSLVGWETGAASLLASDGDEPAHVQIYGVSTGFFEVLGVGIAEGRAVGSGDHDPGAAEVAAVISHRLWQNLFNGSPQVLGRVVKAGVDRVPIRIVGVARRGFSSLGPRTPIDLFVSGAHLARIDKPGGPASEQHSYLAGRLQAGASRIEAAAELDTLDRQFRSSASLEGNGLVVAGTRPVGQPGQIDRFVLSWFTSLGAALLLVLLLACANVGNLQLARLMSRRGEIAVRLSLGASRGRVVGQLLTEALGLAMAAALTGFAAAWILPGLVLRFAGEEPQQAEFSLSPDATVLVFAISLAVLATVAFALAPALRMTREGSAVFVNPRAGVDRRSRHLRSLLLASQIALSFTLLTGAGLLTRGIMHVHQADLGFDVHGTAVARVTMPPDVRTRSALAAVAVRLSAALRESAPGPVGLLNHVPPLSSLSFETSVRKPGEEDLWNRRTLDRPMSAESFAILGLEFIAGGPHDDQPDSRQAVVNESLARLLFPGEVGAAAVGRTVMARRPVQGAVFEAFSIAGVVRDSYFTSPAEIAPLFHAAPVFRQQMYLVFKNQADAASRVRTIVESVQPGAVVSVAPVAEAIQSAIEDRRTGARLAWIIGLLGLALATIGVFGVFAYFVEERRREIGIRLALGARVPQILRAMFAAHRWSVGIGVAAGLLLSAGAGFALRSYLFGLSPLDPLAYLVVALLLSMAAALATVLPSRRAWRVDPAVTLRTE